ncbi:MAG TPA: heme-binding protein [Blastocatellia bacterium]|nr:heme-binding protein [Blastocatellia bacterium]
MKIKGYVLAITLALLVGLYAGANFSLTGNAANKADNNSRGRGNPCQGLPTERQLAQYLRTAPNTDGDAGGLFNGKRMWGALVNRDGGLCGAATSTDDPTQVWPGSQAIAKAKAYTANAYSLDSLALSTARLYTFTQPGHSLWSLAGANNFNPHALTAPDGDGRDHNRSRGGDIIGGQIYFGGGVPLYKDGKIIGALGISGDTSCADHEIAKRVRDLAGLNPPGGKLVDDITYSNPDGASVFTHPLCVNTYRNGGFIGNEAVATGY